MILNVYTDALQKDIEKITWLPAVIIIIKVIIYLVSAILIFRCLLAILRIRKESIRIRELLEEHFGDVDDDDTI